MELNPRVFWSNVKKLRKSKGFSQQHLADILGLNVKNYNNKERGFAASLSSSLAEAIATALGTTVEELSQGEPPEKPLINPKVANFWKNVKLRREDIGLSQSEVAAKIGISTNNYQAKESGRATKLPQDLAGKVASVLNCTIEDLMPSEEQLQPVSAPQPSERSQVQQLNSYEPLEKPELTFPYPAEVIFWMNTKEGASIVMDAYKNYLLEKMNNMF